MRILITSNIEARDIFRKFSDAAYTIDICYFDSFIESVEQFGPDLVLLHCGCRVRNCLQKLRAIKAEFPAIPVIFLTRVSAEHIAIEAFRLGAKDYFKEPFDFPKLHETIDNLAKYIRQNSGRRQAAISPASILNNNSDATMPSNISNVIRFMEKNMSKNISLEQLAREAAMSKHHFCRVFKKHTGIPPMNFLTGKRIERSKILMLDEERTIADVIEAAGFHDQSNFIKNFKKIEGITPSIYRRDNLCPQDHLN
jgi:YesN/AraC family two-component response regulator